MRTRRDWVVWFGAWVLELTPVRAFADVPPPPTQEERCSLDKTCPRGQECVLCRGDVLDLSAPTSACDMSLAPLGFEYQCQSFGSHAWNEIWCRPARSERNRDANIAVAPLDADAGRTQVLQPVVCDSSTSGCSCSLAAGQERHVLTWGFVAGAALAVWRLRRRGLRNVVAAGERRVMHGEA